MSRSESHFEVGEKGKVKLVSASSPLKRQTTDASDPAITSPIAFLQPGGDDYDGPSGPNSPTDFGEDHDQLESMPSIAQPLKQHGSVFMGKMEHAAGRASATAALRPVRASRLPSDATPPSDVDGGNSNFSPAAAFPSDSFETSDIIQRGASASSSRRASSALHSFLCTVPHVCTLSMDQISALRIMVREYDALDTVIEQGTTLQHVYVLASGTVEVFDLRQHQRAVSHKRIASITAPNMFGAESLIFDKPSEFSYSASSNNTTILLIAKSQFLELFTKSSVFAHSLGSRLTLSMPQFNVFQDFCRSVFAMSSVVAEVGKCEGYTLHLPAILDSYARIGTIIHPLLEKADIDINALQYACARLPANITETFVINLARSLPPFLATELRARQRSSSTDFVGGNSSFTSAGKDFMLGSSNTSASNPNVVYVATSNRRRSAWRIGDKGYTLVLMRDGFTDVVDFMTAFCIHVLEARKLRIRLQSMISPRAPDVLNDAIAAIKENNLHTSEIEELQRHVLGQLPLTSAERAGLLHMWPHTAIQKLYHIIMHQEQYIVRVDTSLSKRFASDSYFQWALKIRSHIFKALKCSENDSLPENVTISILSSRHRSTKNLLCSLVETHMESIEGYHDASVDIPGLSFFNTRDRWFYTLFRMINEDGALRDEYKTVLKDCGFATFEDHTSSGLQVDVIDVSKLKVQLVDPFLREAVVDAMASKNRKFIINVDFTFGGQAEGIMRALFLMFGHRITSVNVVGKCAGISGCRGDVLLPKKLIFSKAAFGEDTADEFRNCLHTDVTAADIRELIDPARKVHTGSCVTIPGMILQNDALIRFYKIVYQADGMEMESSYIERQVKECANLAVLRSDIHTRHVFYMSDMPKGNEDGSKSAGKSRSSAESITTMYASLRAVLKATLTGL
jgi:hypothetical protein